MSNKGQKISGTGGNVVNSSMNRGSIWISGCFSNEGRGMLLLYIVMLILLLLALSSCSDGDADRATIDTSEIELPPRSDSATDPAIPLETPEGGPARYAVESGRVVMEYKGLIRGVRRMYFRDYGLSERIFDSAYASRTPLPFAPPHVLMIRTPEYYGAIDMRLGKGEKAENRAMAAYLDLWKKENRPLGEIALERSGGIRLNDTVLLERYKCRVYQQTQQGFIRTIWTWGGIPIREQVVLEGSAGGTYTVEPVAIDTKYPIADSLFVFPEGYLMETLEAPPFDSTAGAESPNAGRGTGDTAGR